MIAISAGGLTAAALWLFFWWNDKDGDQLDDRLQEIANPAAAAATPRSHRSSLALPMPCRG